MAKSPRKPWLFRHSAGWLACCLLVVASWSDAASRDGHLSTQQLPDQDLIQQTWQHTRLGDLCETMVRNILDGVRHHPELATLPEAQRAGLISQYEQFATTERFEARLRSYLATTEPSALRAMVALTESAVGRRAFQEEIDFRAVSPEMLAQYRTSLDGRPDGLARVAAIQRLDNAIGVTEMAITVAAASLYGTTIALRERDRVNQLSDVTEKLAGAVKRFVAHLRSAQQEQVQMTYLYLYRNLSLDELDAYVTQYEREPVRGMQRRLIEALGAEMIAVQGDVIRSIVGQSRNSASADI